MFRSRRAFLFSSYVLCLLTAVSIQCAICHSSPPITTPARQSSFVLRGYGSSFWGFIRLTVAAWLLPSPQGQPVSQRRRSYRPTMGAAGALHPPMVPTSTSPSLPASPRELAVTFTDTESCYVSEASVYRPLKANDLITSNQAVMGRLNRAPFAVRRSALV